MTKQGSIFQKPDDRLPLSTPQICAHLLLSIRSRACLYAACVCLRKSSFERFRSNARFLGDGWFAHRETVHTTGDGAHTRHVADPLFQRRELPNPASPPPLNEISADPPRVAPPPERWLASYEHQQEGLGQTVQTMPTLG